MATPDAQPMDGRTAFTTILADVRFPAPRWMLVAQALSWGAHADYIDQLSRLPDASYSHLEDVLTAIDQAGASTGAS